MVLISKETHALDITLPLDSVDSVRLGTASVTLAIGQCLRQTVSETLALPAAAGKAVIPPIGWKSLVTEAAESLHLSTHRLATFSKQPTPSSSSLPPLLVDVILGQLRLIEGLLA